VIRALYIAGLLVAAVVVYRGTSPDDVFSGFIAGVILGVALMEGVAWIWRVTRG